MRILLTGANGVMGRATIPALQNAGHQVVGLVRSPSAARLVQSAGATAIHGDVLDRGSLMKAMIGCDAVVNFATNVPVGARAMLPGSLNRINRIRTVGAGLVADAAIESDIGLMVQQSLSHIYVARGDEWIDESTPIDVTMVTEPLTVAEQHAQRVEEAGGVTVRLRYGLICGDDPNSQFLVRRARKRRPIGLGDPDSWMHVVHPLDVGTSAVAALGAPSGAYNVGAEPLKRLDYVNAIARAAGHSEGRFFRRWLFSVTADKLELLARSQRVTSQRFMDTTGWKPMRPVLTAEWFRAG
ncbi:NAD-dependent epimerase/dehydratase family protein [Aeromicrobium sp. HA]|uniref:NAD-dependent epimerase/dehydratase family protein n=1 Tax=Aeromicrobium sp. HA TaxID=3009077 RepID=UPI0022AEC328|nr:NAD(P)-dependent oxidoreductase [Aeromicrobium sp. HA]